MEGPSLKDRMCESLGKDDCHMDTANQSSLVLSLREWTGSNCASVNSPCSSSAARLMPSALRKPGKLAACIQQCAVHDFISVNQRRKERVSCKALLLQGV